MVPGIAITAATDGVGAPVWVGALTTTSLYTASSAGQAKGDVERAGGTKAEAAEAAVESGAETAATVMATYAIAEGISRVIKSSGSKAVEEVEGNNNVKPSSNFTEGGNSSIPDKAKQIANEVKNNNGTPPKGYKGGRTYKNIPLEDGTQKLPEGVNYREYDVNPCVKGQNRGAERIVIGDDGSVWYTNDLYFTFTQIE